MKKAKIVGLRERSNKFICKDGYGNGGDGTITFKARIKLELSSKKGKPKHIWQYGVVKSKKNKGYVLEEQDKEWPIGKGVLVHHQGNTF